MLKRGSGRVSRPKKNSKKNPKENPKKNSSPKSVKPASQKILITSAIPYINNIPHLGNIIGCVLSGDVYARYCRLKGHDTLYICGTDEHGTATEAKAIEEGLTPQQICDKYYVIHKSIYEWFGCSFDTFGRTTTAQHAATTQELFLRLYQHGYILEASVEQLYCNSCKTFLADRFVNGVCPLCDYDKARGDQCDQCGKLLNAVELIKPYCKRCGSSPVIKKSDHLFLDLPKIGQKLQAWVKKQSVEGAWPQNAKTVTNAWFTEGLKPRCISRDLRWGIPIPLKGYEKKVFYVWFDAPIGYLSMTQVARKDWRDWWKLKKGVGKEIDKRADKELNTVKNTVKLVQFMAKDNIPFHSILFPATLIGADDNYVLVHHLSSTEYLNYEGGKFSKTNKTGVFGDDAKTSGIPADVWRYYLLVNRPEQADTEFSWDDFQEKNNSELLANVGNFVNRTLTFLQRHFDGVVPAVALAKKDQEFLNHFHGTIHQAGKLLDGVKLKDALRTVMQASKLANAYIQENEPWKLASSDQERCATVVGVCVNVIRSLAVALQPFLPHTSAIIFSQMSLHQEQYDWDSAVKLLIPAGHRISKVSPLFKKLEDTDIQALRARFSGQQRPFQDGHKSLNGPAAIQGVKGEGKCEGKGGSNMRTIKQRSTQQSNDPFSKVDLVVACIVEAQPHPNADKLLVLRVDTGDGKRQICAGIKKDYPSLQELVGKRIILVKNLKPAKLRGELSEGMLLAAKDAQGKLAVLEAPDAKAGDHVKADGMGGMMWKPQDLVSFEDIEQLSLRLQHGNVMYKSSVLKAAGKNLVVHGIREGTIG